MLRREIDAPCEAFTNEMGNRMTKEQKAIKEDEPTNEQLLAKEIQSTKEHKSAKDEPHVKEPQPTKEQLTAKESKKSAFQKFLARFHLYPNKKEQITPKTVNTDGIPPPKPPLRTHAERSQSKEPDSQDGLNNIEWTDVSLQVPESPPTSKEVHEIKITPVPPPRKHKIKIQEILETPKRAKAIDAQVSTPLVPIEEPIIVPQKVIEHVCDGTHHHVHNVVDGIVVDQIIVPKENKVKHTPAKNASTLSLPSYDDIKKKTEKNTRSPTKPNKKKSSITSLDKKNKTHSTAEKLESYMTRCKSFGSILPNQKSDKSKSMQDDSDKESEDSWGGLEDWDLGIIEHDVSTDVQRAPVKSKLRQIGDNLNTESKEKANSVRPNNFEGIDRLIASIDDDINKQNESIKSSHPQSQSPSEESRKPIPSPSYPFKKNPNKNAFENDSFFTSEFLKNESRSEMYYKPSKVKLAPLAGFDSDKESEKDVNNEGSFGEKTSPNDSKKSVAFKLSVDKEHPEVAQVESDRVEEKVILRENAPQATPRRRSGIGHSNLLKFIKDDLKNNDFKSKTQIETKLEREEYNDKSNHMEEESKIIPQIRKHKIDASWQQLLKREDINNTPLLEQESSLSDLVETSSDDTRSTVETKLKI